VIVVDANVISYLILKGDHSEDCGKLFVEDSEWAAPRLWRDEVANVLATYERQGCISREEALLAFSDAEAIMSENEYDVSIEKILSVAGRTGCSGYDSQYISLAEELGVSLYTYDKKVLRMAASIAKRPMA